MNSMLLKAEQGESGATTPKIGAILLAAGFSSRMGLFKPLLPLNGMPAIAVALASLHNSGITEIIVVLGHRAEELCPIVEASGAHSVLNPFFAEGMFTSVRAGAKALSERVEAAFVLPVDIPLVRPATMRRLIETFAAHRNAVTRPRFGGRPGHPPLLAQQVLQQAACAQEAGPLSAVLARFAADTLDAPVADEAIHMDMDTPEDYAALARFAGRHEIPTCGECSALYAIYGVPSGVVRHCRAVARVALCLAEALAQTGSRLDLELIEAGALLHDLAKGSPKHAQAGATILEAMEMPSVAAIVAAHMEMEDELPPIDERSIVFLADKLVREDRYVGLDERLAYKRAGFPGDVRATDAAHRRIRKAANLLKRIEAELGVSLDGSPGALSTVA